MRESAVAAPLMNGDEMKNSKERKPMRSSVRCQSFGRLDLRFFEKSCVILRSHA